MALQQYDGVRSAWRAAPGVQAWYWPRVQAQEQLHARQKTVMC